LKAVRYLESTLGVLFLLFVLWDGRMPPPQPVGWNMWIFPWWMKAAALVLALTLMIDAQRGFARLRRENARSPQQ
jgi:hypothetical protein